MSKLGGDGAQHLRSGGNDFGTNAVTGEQKNRCVHRGILTLSLCADRWAPLVSSFLRRSS
jgi:hypothetical protein